MFVIYVEFAGTIFLYMTNDRKTTQTDTKITITSLQNKPVERLFPSTTDSKNTENEF